MLKFNEILHEYQLNGERLPSVSEILNTVLGSPYGSVPQHILDNAAEWGTTVHKAIETDFILALNEIQERQYNDFQSLLLNTALIISKEHELRVHYENIYAGTMDLLIEASYHLNYAKAFYIIADIKTTYSLNKDRTAWQLSLYAWAYEKMTGRKIEKLLVYWLPKRKSGSVHELERKTDKEIEWLLSEYKKKAEE